MEVEGAGPSAHMERGGAGTGKPRGVAEAKTETRARCLAVVGGGLTRLEVGVGEVGAEAKARGISRPSCRCWSRG